MMECVCFELQLTHNVLAYSILIFVRGPWPQLQSAAKTASSTQGRWQRLATVHFTTSIPLSPSMHLPCASGSHRTSSPTQSSRYRHIPCARYPEHTKVHLLRLQQWSGPAGRRVWNIMGVCRSRRSAARALCSALSTQGHSCQDTLPRLHIQKYVQGANICHSNWALGGRSSRVLQLTSFAYFASADEWIDIC